MSFRFRFEYRNRVLLIEKRHDGYFLLNKMSKALKKIVRETTPDITLCKLARFAPSAWRKTINNQILQISHETGEKLCDIYQIKNGSIFIHPRLLESFFKHCHLYDLAQSVPKLIATTMANVSFLDIDYDFIRDIYIHDQVLAPHTLAQLFGILGNVDYNALVHNERIFYVFWNAIYHLNYIDLSEISDLFIVDITRLVKYIIDSMTGNWVWRISLKRPLPRICLTAEGIRLLAIKFQAQKVLELYNTIDNFSIIYQLLYPKLQYPAKNVFTNI